MCVFFSRFNSPCERVVTHSHWLFVAATLRSDNDNKTVVAAAAADDDDDDDEEEKARLARQVTNELFDRCVNVYIY